MGQVGLVQGIYNFVLHSLAMVLALVYVHGRIRSLSMLQLIGMPLLTFAVAFVFHIAAFIALKQIFDSPVSPWIHRPVVAVLWGLACGLTLLVALRTGLKPMLLTSALATASYLAFVFTRHWF